MSDDIERCARLMGMKRTEVLEVVPADGGDLVRTHDGQWTLVRDSGELVHRADGPTPVLDPDGIPPEVLEDVVDLAEAFTEAAAAKPVPKRRPRA